MNDRDSALYSQCSSAAAYIQVIRFALDKLELYIDEIGDELFYNAQTENEFGDCDEFGAFYTPAQAGCDCEDCVCNKGESKEKYFDWIDDVLRKTRRAPQDYRMD